MGIHSRWEQYIACDERGPSSLVSISDSMQQIIIYPGTQCNMTYIFTYIRVFYGVNLCTVSTPYMSVWDIIFPSNWKEGSLFHYISGDSWMYPYQRTPMGNKSLYRSQKWWVFMGYNPQESLENTINTMPTRTLGVHPSPAGFGQILHPVTKLNSPRILCRGELHSRRHISRRTFSDRKGILSKCNDLVHMRCFLWFPDVFTFNRLNNVFKLIHQYYISPALTYLQLNVRKNGESYNQPTTNQPTHPTKLWL